MKTSTIVILVVVALLAIGGITIFSSYVSYNNKEVSLRAQSDAQIKVIEGYHDAMWKIITQKAGVTQEYAASFDSIYTHIMEGRYSGGSQDGSLMKWIQESNPSFDASLYKDLMNTIEVQRIAFKNAQEKEIDIIREHETLLKTMPSCWFISDKRPIEYTVVSSTKSKMTMETGLDDDVELFKKYFYPFPYTKPF